jgi:hypothetical protein
MARDFRPDLQKQLEFIERSCLAYDAGAYAEAVRIATAIRILVHDTGHSTSLLRHLGVRATIQLLSSCDPSPDRFPNKPSGYTDIFEFCLGTLVSDGTSTWHEARFRPDQRIFPMSVEAWWQQVVWRLNPETAISRKALVLAAANKDGGAHVDAELSGEYEQLAAGPFRGFFQVVSSDPSVSRMHLQSLRILGEEVLRSSALRNL